MKYWLIKSEPSCYSIDEFAHDKKTAWTDIRNYQARNFMRDDMKPGDQVFFYHSSDVIKGVKSVPAIVGLAKVGSLSHPDATALDKKNDHYDPKATKENPIWYCVDMTFVKKFKTPFTLAHIKFHSDLADMMVAQQGSRLSIQLVSEAHFKRILKLVK